MSLYKSNERPACMERTSEVLSQEEVAQVVVSLSYEGLQMAAALGLSFSRSLGMFPAEVDAALSDMIQIPQEQKNQEKTA